MNSIVKGLIIGGAIAVLGAVIAITALAVCGWTVKPKLQMKTFTSAEEVSSVYVRQDEGSVKLSYYDGDEIVVEYPENKLFKATVECRDGKLTVESCRKWYVIGSFRLPETVIKLPSALAEKPDVNLKLNAGSANLGSGAYGNVTANINAGQFTAGEITCATLKCNINAGQIKITGVRCTVLNLDVDAGKTEIISADAVNTAVDVDAGSVHIGFAGAHSEYTINVKVDAGSCNVSNSTGTTEKTITVDVDAGEAKLDFAG